ncbi:cohesin domain-containing protein [Herbivorax sp. ANBcel31]|uniref:cohesin domain-containing protein n=1 Tax=Herbivorax sp. ANBcel31 TaxID=3069754 RepID=UPI0027B4AF26|nr:cohesin domain-containing protein [Herbivorax sp. ANBcel31]MDQ2086158.1 cohesin domain-containing protein [Herbivorax sp. ANBcel31]
MKKNICRVLVVALLLTTVFVVANSNLESLVEAFDAMSNGTAESSLSIDFDKSTAEVGDIIIAEINVHNIENLAGFQANIKYDPEILEAVNPDTGVALTSSEIPDNGDVLVNDEYGALSTASNDIEEGILNFSKTYIYLDDYKMSGDSEETGTLVAVGFKVLKEEATVVSFEDTNTMPNSTTGTMLYNWEGERNTDYVISQPVVINGEDSDEGEDSTPIETQPPAPSDGSISLELDRNSASVGDIINADIKIDNIDYLSGYQVNIKYDPEVLQAVNPNTQNAFSDGTAPIDGTLISNDEYGAFSTAANNVEEGILNFGKVYTFINDYRMSGEPENSTGTLGTIGFKVLKEENAIISFEEADTMPNGISGTLLFDWEGARISDYSVIQPDVITLSSSTQPPVETPDPVTDGYIEIELDRTSAQVGEIIKADINVDDITNLAGYQVNIKYDPAVLEAVNAETGDALGQREMMGNREIIANSEYSPISVVDTNFSDGILSFASTYSYLEDYRQSGNPEESGTLGVIGFKVLSEESTNIRFEETAAGSATSLFNWYGDRLSNYTVIQPETVNDGGDDTDSGTGDISQNYISIEADKNTASVGDIVTALVSVNNIDNLAGYQVSIKYDPEVLEPVNTSGDVYGTRTMPEGGTVITNEEFMPLSVSSHDLPNGRLSFGKTYADLNSLKDNGINESTGILAEISFRVLSNENTEVSFEQISSMPQSVSGTLLYDWDGNRISDYSVQNSAEIN